MAKVYRFLIRSRGARLRGDSVPDPKDVRQVAFVSAAQTIDLGATPAELESVLRTYVEDIPLPSSRAWRGGKSSSVWPANCARTG